MKTWLAFIRFVDEQVPGLALGSTLFAVPVETPSSDIGFVTIEETGGAGPQGTHDEPRALRRPSFQIVARQGKNYALARALAGQAWDVFGEEGAANVLVHVDLSYVPTTLRPFVGNASFDVFFLWMRPTQEPFSLGPDPASRPRAAFNVETMCRIVS